MKTSIEQILLRELSPAAAVVDARGRVLHLSGPVDRWLEAPRGPTTSRVVDLVRKPLRLEVRTALHEAVKERREVVRERIAAAVEGRRALLDVVVRPLLELGGDACFLVVFRERDPGPGAAAPPPDAAGAAPGEAERLRAELRATKEHLQASAEALEMLDAELSAKVEQLDRAHADLGHLHRRMEESRREADHRKDELLALLGHELRNPLAPLQNAIQLLRRRPEDAEARARALDMMERQVRQLGRLVHDLLDVERIARGKVHLRPAPLDLAELLRASLDDHRSAFAEAGVTLHTRLPEGPVPVDGDGARLAQAVGNLLQNAVNFTPGGGRVDVVLEVALRRAELRVRDSGVGMEPAFLPRLFEPFAQEDASLSRNGSGLGLGLALVRGVAELHGGSARAASAGRGRGSELVVTLPLGASAPAPFGPARAGAALPRPFRILLVDDNGDAAESLGELLELEGHAVRVARDGAAGLAAAREFLPDVVVCDIGLPGALDGYGVARALRADPALRGSYLVALTGYAGAGHRQLAAEAGFDLHVTKPPSLDDIAAIVTAASAHAAR